jgi:CHAD domain-containing protein
MKGRLFQRVLATQREFTSVRQLVASSFEVQRAGTRQFQRTLLDTFDQRLRRAGRCLELDADGGARVRMCGIGTETDFLEQPLITPVPEPLLVPTGPVESALQPLLGGRALLPQCVLSMRVSDFRVIDAEGKIRATLSREQVMGGASAGRGRTLLNVMRLWPLRGYEKTCGRLFAELDGVLGGTGSEWDPARKFLALFSKMHKDAPVNAPVPLGPRQSAARALGLILLGQLRILAANVDGIRSDTDAEFLHDFRIACRRSRSLLTQVRGAFPGRGTASFRETFAWLSAGTSPQRDLDVFLSALPGLSARLSGRHERALAPLLDALVVRRRQAHADLVLTLSGVRFRNFLPEWRHYLEGFAGRHAPRINSAPYALDAANDALRRLHRRLLRDGARCGVGTYSPVLHELRKDGKKLRYLLEAFRTLYPPAEVDEVLRRLRKLQGVLGDIVDYHVQREWLRQWQQEFLARTDTDPQALAAMTELGLELDRLELEAQQGFVRRFEQFAAEPVRTAMERLLAAKP